MTNKVWNRATPLGSLRAGDLISALNRVARARSRDERSPLSGSMLYFTGTGEVLVWAGDDAQLAVIPITLSSSGATDAWFAAVPSGYVAAIRQHVERSDVIELGGSADAGILVRRPGEHRTLVQPVWTPQPLIDVYNGFLIDTLADGVFSARGSELLAGVRAASDTGALTLVIERETLTVGSGTGGEGAAVGISSTLPPRSIVCDRELLEGAVDTVTDIKFPQLNVEVRDAQQVLKLYGSSRSEPPTFSAVDYLIRTGQRSEHGRSSAVPAGSVAPAEAWIDEPAATQPVDVILAELDAIVGQTHLKKEVRGLLHQVEINRLREAQGLKPSRVGSHLVFAGPPGTGKTTIARLIARLYHALGVLENAEVKEVSRPDLVAPNIGGTEEKTAQAVAEAIGGVLFIDEAYTLAQGGENDFGRQAIDILVKELEDKRSQFVCIIAGYSDQMKDFMKANPGLASRFRPPISFVQYSAEELVRIASDMADGMDNRLSDDARIQLMRRLEDEERRGGFGRKEWGNARAMRNVIEAGITHRDMRISLSGAHDYESLVVLTAEDIGAACDDLAIGRTSGREETVEDVLAELDAQIGQPALKRQIRAILAQAKVQQRKQEHGGANTGFALEHLLFVGPPGTGKTTIARLIARLYRALGLLPKSEIVEVDRQSLVAGYVGQTAKQTSARIDEAMGGVLFIDEAYALAKGGANDFGREAIDALLPRLENDKGKFLAIAAGYPDDMAKLLETNVGLKSRFTVKIEFTTYTAEELVGIADSMADGRGEHLTPEARSILLERLTAAEKAGVFTSSDWGNARSVRNVLDRAVQQRDLRISEGDLAQEFDTLFTVEAEDMTVACDIEQIAAATADESVEDVLAELDAQIGQPALKAKIRELLAQARFDVQRREAGLTHGPVPIEHLLFVGPPGTGKTTIARLIARLYRALGLLPRGGTIEVDRGALVGQHIGSTAPKTTERIDAAMGGVLFIDEAYTLAKGGENDFGKEAIDTLLPRLENDRGKFLVIAAGYPDDMDRFVASNDGLGSRFTERIEFQPYTVEELTEIAVSMAGRAGQQLDEEASEAFRTRFAAAESAGAFSGRDWGNARQARVVVEGAMKARDLRLSVDGFEESAELVTITEADIHTSCDRYRIGVERGVPSRS